MSSEVFDFFPLTIFKDKILIPKKEKNKIVEFICNVKENKNFNKREGDAWLGDTQGHEYLFKNPIMKNIANLVSEKIKLYTEMLSLDITSWGGISITITLKSTRTTC